MKMKTILKNGQCTQMFFFVKGGGCNGYQYTLEPLMKPGTNKTDETIPIDGTNQLVVCGKSLIHIIGVTIDYKQTIMGNGFEFHNPNSSGNCGCGKSFN